MFEALLQNVASPNALINIVAVLLALFARDVVVGALRALAKRVKEDRDPGNDWMADAALVIVGAVEKVRFPGRK
jgi:capsular polysaccharide biosynthesis protein